MTVDQAGGRLPELIERARLDHDAVVLTAGDRPVAAIVSIEDYRELRAAQDAADIALCERSKENSEGAVTHEELVAMLAAEDAAGS